MVENVEEENIEIDYGGSGGRRGGKKEDGRCINPNLADVVYPPLMYVYLCGFMKKMEGVEEDERYHASTLAYCIRAVFLSLEEEALKRRKACSKIGRAHV